MTKDILERPEVPGYEQDKMMILTLLEIHTLILPGHTILPLYGYF